jgi:hypothetical protein
VLPIFVPRVKSFRAAPPQKAIVAENKKLKNLPYYWGKHLQTLSNCAIMILLPS